MERDIMLDALDALEKSYRAVLQDMRARKPATALPIARTRQRAAALRRALGLLHLPSDGVIPEDGIEQAINGLQDIRDHISSQLPAKSEDVQCFCNLYTRALSTACCRLNNYR